MTDPVVIVGGGFSGTLLAINLLRFGGPDAVLVERAGDRIARGVAYSATEPAHLLNVRAAGMSAFPDDAGHFVRWLGTRDAGSAQTFVPRLLYGEYLRETLDAVRDARLTLIEGDVVDVDAGGVTLADGRRVAADSIVLATGNLPPHTPPGVDPALLPSGRYIDDPWRSRPGEGLGAEDVVVLLGTGLTAIDVALQLDASGFAGTVLAMSRRGLKPRRHRDGLPPPTGETDLPGVPLSGIVRQLRERAAREGWRAAVDAMRPITQRLWSASDAATRKRFLRHVRPFWDVHRHRLAPPVADRIDMLVESGRLRFVAGKVASVTAEGAGVCIQWRPRHGDDVEPLRAARIVNCTGPQGDLTRTDDTLLRTLAARGAIRPDPLRLGIDVDAQSRVIDGEGRAQDALCCIGPMTRGGLWEVVAVPDIRRQAWDLARRLSHAQWVGGEGL
ncbi:FAD/NAD(P)-binding protein [Sphingomonas sp. Leaf343]|uniref:FAD/NAD(P)-binding protein n=1 Tax=Sphingomonas sp. Leaf343 TaxID=1736345 RepID=UPI0006FF593A|nr:FAD/NAD(P)-binding protein [Sphingomonas sp. Leaf343]KQR87700.1 FAD-dependent oxidoreductase [Sphingomonas sp. Leaf343]